MDLSSTYSKPLIDIIDNYYKEKLLQGTRVDILEPFSREDLYKAFKFNNSDKESNIIINARAEKERLGKLKEKTTEKGTLEEIQKAIDNEQFIIDVYTNPKKIERQNKIDWKSLEILDEAIRNGIKKSVASAIEDATISIDNEIEENNKYKIKREAQEKRERKEAWIEKQKNELSTFKTSNIIQTFNQSKNTGDLSLIEDESILLEKQRIISLRQFIQELESVEHIDNNSTGFKESKKNISTPNWLKNFKYSGNEYEIEKWKPDELLFSKYEEKKRKMDEEL